MTIFQKLCLPSDSHEKSEELNLETYYKPAFRDFKVLHSG